MAADLGFDYKECFTRCPRLKEEDLEELRVWMRSQDKSSSIPKDIHDKQLVLFHNACDYNLEWTKRCIKVYYTCREKSPDFSNRDLDLPEMQQAMEVLEFIVMPNLSYEGYVVMFHRLHDYEPARYDYDAANKLSHMSFDTAMYEVGPAKGGILLFDLQGAKVGHLFRPSIKSMSRLMKYLQEGLPLRIKALHVFNCTPFFDKILLLVKPFMHKDLMSILHLHQVDMDWEKFYKEVLPRNCLPSDFGGDLEDTQTLHKRNMERVRARKAYFDAEEKHRQQYHKKATSPDKIEHSFSKLEID